VDANALKVALAQAGVGDVVAVSKPAWRPQSDVNEECFEGTMVVAGLPLRFGFWLPGGFPVSLPKIFGLSSEVQRLPHVDEHSLICAFEEENTLLDYRAEDNLVRETVQRVRSVIEDGLLGLNRDEFLTEFEAYWPRQVDVLSAVTPNDKPSEIKASLDGSSIVALADGDEALRSYFPNRTKQLKRGVYLPLDQFDLAGRHPRDLARWTELVPLLSATSIEFAQAMQITKKQSLPVVVGVPRADGDRALVGLHLRKFLNDGSLIDARPRAAEPFTLTRFDAARVRERIVAKGGGHRVVVIGCGSGICQRA